MSATMAVNVRRKDLLYSAMMSSGMLILNGTLVSSDKMEKLLLGNVGNAKSVSVRNFMGWLITDPARYLQKSYLVRPFHLHQLKMSIYQLQL